jgi:hypothetical protein
VSYSSLACFESLSSVTSLASGQCSGGLSVNTTLGAAPFHEIQKTVKLSLFLTKHYAMKTYGGMDL